MPQDNEGQGNPQGKPGQNYVVKVEFTDENGKTWKAGSKFEGDEGAIRKAITAGKIEARSKPEPQA